MNIAYLGKLTFTPEVYWKYFDNGNHNLITYKSLRDIVNSVITRESDLGILPLRNRIIGKINGYNLKGIKIIKRIKMPVQLAIGGLGNEEEIEYLTSKKEALAQCNQYIQDRGLKCIEGKNTVSGIEKIIEQRIKNLAVVCSKQALVINNLNVYHEDISNIKPNYTIFGLICPTEQ